MSTFNFGYHVCFLCGRLCDDGGFVNSNWFCIDCLDSLSDVYSDVSF